MAIQERDNAQYILVIFIVAYGFGVGFKEGHIFGLCEFFAEFVDIDRFVIGIHLSIIEGLLRYKIHDVVVIVNSHHRAIHPTFIFSHQSEVGM